MTLPAAYPISLSQIAIEYGATLPLSLLSVLGKPGLPTTAPVSFSDCLGKSAPAAGGAPYFTPSGSTNSASPTSINNLANSETINCSAVATWTYTRTGSTRGSANVGSGGSAAAITFSINALPATTVTATFNLTATSGGVTNYYTVVVTDSLQ